MIDPALKDLMDKVDCRYQLVAVISKRARTIVDEANKAGEPSSKQVSAAVDDLICDRLAFRYGESAE